MRHARVAAACLLLGGVSLADEATLFVPASMAAGISEGERWGTYVGVEIHPSGALVSLTQTLRPLGSSLELPLRDAAACGDPEALVVDRGLGAALPEALALRRSGAALDAVEEIVRFVSNAVVADEHDRGPQDAASVLARRRGRCSGRANLAVGILREIGVPARVVHGVLIGDGVVRLHRWGEAWIGGPEWVPFDPGASVGVVSVRYLPVRDAEEASLAAVEVRAVSEEGFAGLPVRGGLRLMPVGGVAVSCRAGDVSQRVLAVLVGPDGSRRARQGGGAVRFDGLLPGLYRLSWVSGGERGKMAVLRLGETREVHLNLVDSGG